VLEELSRLSGQDRLPGAARHAKVWYEAAHVPSHEARERQINPRVHIHPDMSDEIILQGARQQPVDLIVK